MTAGEADSDTGRKLLGSATGGCLQERIRLGRLAEL